MGEVVGGGGMDEFHPGIVADDVDMALGVGGEAAGDRGEVGEGFREGEFEEGNEVVGSHRRLG